MRSPSLVDVRVETPTAPSVPLCSRWSLLKADWLPFSLRLPKTEALVVTAELKADLEEPTGRCPILYPVRLIEVILPCIRRSRIAEVIIGLNGNCEMPPDEFYHCAAVTVLGVGDAVTAAERAAHGTCKIIAGFGPLIGLPLFPLKFEKLTSP